jgi:hypothetical protein
MKNLSLISFILVIATALNAHAGPLANRAEKLADRLKAVEGEMTRRDSEDARYAIDQLEYILQNYRESNGSAKLICLSNGESSVWEKFVITDIMSNQKLGGYTTKETCESLLRNQRKGLICISNGESSVWEKFVPLQIADGKKLGGYTTLETCQTLVQKSTPFMACVSNGESSVWEKFMLLNRKTNAYLGGATTLENCLSSVR